MKDYKKEVYCNVCGEMIKKVPKANVCKEHLRIQKDWGYFSSKDFMTHSFVVCEKCYDKWVQTFAIPVEKEITTEWACTLVEEPLKFKDRESQV